MLDELGQRHPACGVHVQMLLKDRDHQGNCSEIIIIDIQSNSGFSWFIMTATCLVGDVLLVDDVCMHAAGAVAAGQQTHESIVEGLAEVVHHFANVLSSQQRLPLMRLRHHVALEPVLRAKTCFR